MIPDGLTKITEEDSGEGDSVPNPANQRSILVVPISTRADEIGAKVLTKTAAHLPGFHFHVVSTALLANEIIERLEQNNYDAVIVSGLSPFTSTKARLIVKRIRNSLPSLPVLSGLWKATSEQSPNNKTVSQTTQVYERVDDAVSAINDVPRRSVANEPALFPLRSASTNSPTNCVVVGPS
jgi:methylmalonyl-CoA mutase cobalamin-binding subunit